MDFYFYTLGTNGLINIDIYDIDILISILHMILYCDEIHRNFVWAVLENKHREASESHFSLLLHEKSEKRARNEVDTTLQPDRAKYLTHSIPTAKQLFPGFFDFSSLFSPFQDLDVIAMPNSHLVLH